MLNCGEYWEVIMGGGGSSVTQQVGRVIYSVHF